MNENIFAETDAAIAKANGSKDPEAVASCHRSKIFIASPLMGTITGMAIRYASLGVVSVNRRLNDIWKPFALWHELAHVFRGHIDEDGFGMHQDRGLFTVTVDSHTISRQEKEANLISAEYNLDTDEILALIGYHNRTLQDYRELKKKQEEITQAYNNLRFSVSSETASTKMQYRLAEYRHNLQSLDEKCSDLEADLVSMNCARSLSEIANELGTNEVILKYKLEAMRMRGFGIDVAELERYDRVFKNAR